MSDMRHTETDGAGQSKQTIGPVAANVIRMRERDKYLTLQAIGDANGISRERVRQILKEHSDLPTVADKRRTFFKCLQCGTIFWLSPSRQRHGEGRFCTRACKKQWHLIPAICDGCGKLFQTKRWNHMALRGANPDAKIFCSRQCVGRWLGSSYPHKPAEKE
jgi:transcription elongation factor Elf1